MSTELPWDRFNLDEEEPELPYKPPDTSWRAQPDTTWPTEPGPPVPEPDPVRPPAPTPVEDAAKKVVRADARNRSARTLIQGLAVDLLAALIAAVATLGGADLLDKQTWITFGVLVLKSFLAAGISYIMRIRKAPTIRTQGEKLMVLPMTVPHREV